MDLSLSLFDLLSLYTEIDEKEGTLLTTRSVIVHQPENPGSAYLIDNLSFYLFISVPRHVKLDVLRQFMINSYCFRHYNSPQSKTSYNYVSKGVGPEEEENPMIDIEIKNMLYLVDERNDTLFDEFLTKTRKNRRTKKEDGEGEEKEEEEEEEESDHGEPLEIECMFSGLENETATPLTMTHVEKLPKIDGHPSECKAFPGHDQYRLTFHNHCIMSYFINRFKREIAFQGNNDMEAITFNVEVLSYTLHNGVPRPTDKVFKGRASEYIDGQLHHFKDKRDRLQIKFPSSRIISYGLLHPSCCDGDTNTTRQQMPNIFANMVNAKKAQYKSLTTAYQTLYVDLYETSKSGRVVHLVDYKMRQLFEKNTLPSSKKRTLTEKPIKNQPALNNFFNKKPRLDETTHK